MLIKSERDSIRDGLPQELIEAAEFISKQCNRCKLYVVGGYLFDKIRGVEPKDIDLLLLVNSDDERVYMELANHILKASGNVIAIRGQNFPVFDWIPTNSSEKYEVSLGRNEDSTTPQAYNQQSVTLTYNLTEDMRRRIFTGKALAYDITSNIFYDPFGGVEDIRNKILRPTSEYFTGSIERPLIAAQTLARCGREWKFDSSVYTYAAQMKRYAGFGMIHEQATSVNKVAIPNAQIWNQIQKAAGDGSDFALFWESLSLLDWLDFFPEIDAMRFVPQDSVWHSEGSVFEHTMLALRVHHKGSFLQKLSVLLHDIGKLTNTQRRVPIRDKHLCYNWDYIQSRWEEPELVEKSIDREKITSYGHDRNFKHTLQLALLSMGNECMFSDSKEFMFISSIIATHMWRMQKGLPTKSQARKIYRTLESHGATIQDLIYVSGADSMGRKDVDADNIHLMTTQFQMLLQLSKDISPKKQLLVSGKDLIEIGFKPGPVFSKILRFVDFWENSRNVKEKEKLIELVKQHYGGLLNEKKSVHPRIKSER